MTLVHNVSSIIKRYFLSGVLVVVPIIITYIVLKFLFEAVDGVLRPPLEKLIGFYIPGFGLIATLLLIAIAGILTRNYVGNRLVSLGENILAHVPFIRPVYTSAKGLLEATTATHAASFKEVALVEYPRKGSWVLCFVAQYMEIEFEGGARKSVCLFIPSTPTPLTGWSIIVPFEEIILVDMSVEQAIKFLVSGGVVSPGFIKRKSGAVWKRPDEVSHETR